MTSTSVDLPDSPVPPGDITGVYYIPVAGLPWKCSWQDLKDFTRDPQDDGTFTEVDHAMVYPGGSGTDGWVRVKGRSNFYKALARLNGGLLKNKALVADGRNETQWTPLRASKVCSGIQRMRNDSISTAGFSLGSSYTMEMQSPSTLGYASSEYSEWHPLQQNNFIPMSPTYSGTYRQMYSPADPHIPTYTLQPVLTYITAPVSYVIVPPPTPPQYEWPRTPMIKMEARKVIITKLPHNCDETTLQNFLNHILQKVSRKIQGIEIARQSSDGENKGYAFVLFESHSIAKKAVELLVGQKFRGRSIQVRLAKEGAKPSRQDPEISYLPPSEVSVQYSESNSSVSHSNSNHIARQHTPMVCSSNLHDLSDRGRHCATPAVVNGSSERKSFKSMSHVR